MKEEKEEMNDAEDVRKELSKEEILARSRKENEKGDEREQGKWKWTTYCGYISGLITILIIEFTYILLHYDESYFYPLYIFLGMTMSAQVTCQAIVMHKGKGKKITTVCAIFLVVVTIFQWILFGLSLAGIEL